MSEAPGFPVGDDARSAAQPHPEVLKALLAEILSDMATSFGTDPARGGTNLVKAVVALDARSTLVRGGLAPWQIRVVGRHIDQHLDEKILQADLARLANLSPSYFAAAFKRSYGMPPHSYVIRCRIERAQDLILTTDEPLSQIAVACGLGDQAHLTKLFRCRTGMTPNAWRREYAVRPRRVAAR
jgi:transcriptional regulator GlxA family with amidase domain